MELKFGPSLAGRVSGQRTDREEVNLSTGAPAALIVELNQGLPRESRYATLVHELAHVYCGHLGVPRGAWWADRQSLDLRRREFEAEAVAWIVCSRQGLDPGSYRYLESFLGREKHLPEASLNQIVVAANHIEMLGSKRFRPRKAEKARRGAPPRAGTLSVNTGRPYDEEDERLAAEIIREVEAEASGTVKR